MTRSDPYDIFANNFLTDAKGSKPVHWITPEHPLSYLEIISHPQPLLVKAAGRTLPPSRVLLHSWNALGNCQAHFA